MLNIQNDRQVLPVQTTTSPDRLSSSAGEAIRATPGQKFISVATQTDGNFTWLCERCMSTQPASQPLSVSYSAEASGSDTENEYFSADEGDNVELALASPSTAVAADVETSQEVVSSIILDMDELLEYLKRLPKDENSSYFSENYMSVEDFQRAIKLLKHINPDLISKGAEENDGCDPDPMCDGASDTNYHVYYEGKVLLKVTRTDTGWLDSGVTGHIILESPLFDELYYAPEAPGYQEELEHFNMHQC